MTEFKNRVFGCAVVKAINSNYNADFSGQPRTLPSGIVYATDKAFKYVIKKYLKDVYSNEKIFYYKRFDPQKNDFIPFSLIEAFCNMFPDLAEITKNKSNKKVDSTETESNEEIENIDDNEKNIKETIKLKASKKQIGNALLSCIDIRFFGATFAAKGSKKEDNVAISIHGPVQINHGVNIWKENNIFTEQILSPFRNPGDTEKQNEKETQDKQATTLGRQSKLEEGHYLHHFSINPNNLKDIIAISESNQMLTDNDIYKLKEGMSRGATYYDSASKAGCENEMLVWVQLRENSKIVLPNFITLIKLLPEKQDDKYVYDFKKFTEKLKEFKEDIEIIEVYSNKQNVRCQNLPENTSEKDI